jgi:exodeoxyribonuclease V alpha subunit
VQALTKLWKSRIAVLTGSAGTGKTSVVRTFLDGLRDAEGPQPDLLTAQTGKACVRLMKSTKRPASTIHSVLNRLEMLGPNGTFRREPASSPRRVTTLVIDEASMPSIDLLAALMRAIDMGAIRRLVLVGDPFQLPPIGPGRPFSEIIAWLREHAPDSVAELETCMRVTADESGEEMVSPGLSLASAYRDTALPADDTLLSELAVRRKIGDLEIAFWEGQDQLHAILRSRLEEELGIRPGDYQAFNESIGFSGSTVADPGSALWHRGSEPYHPGDLPPRHPGQGQKTVFEKSAPVWRG